MVSIAYIYFLKKLDLHPQLMQSSSTEIADQVLKPPLRLVLSVRLYVWGQQKLDTPHKQSGTQDYTKIPAHHLE